MDRKREEKDLQKRINQARKAQVVDKNDPLINIEDPKDIKNFEDFAV